MSKYLFDVCPRYFELPYLTFTCWSNYPNTLTEGPFDSSVWYGLDFHQNSLQNIRLYQCHF